MTTPSAFKIRHCALMLGRRRIKESVRSGIIETGLAFGVACINTRDFRTVGGMLHGARIDYEVLAVDESVAFLDRIGIDFHHDPFQGRSCRFFLTGAQL